MRRVLIESPFSGPTPEQEEEHVRYARACIKDALSHGDAPLASHLLYTQPGILNDDIPEERQWGIDAGIEWYKVAQACVVYTDYPVSKGMQYGIDRAKAQGIPVEYRTVPGWKTNPSLQETFALSCAFHHEQRDDAKKTWTLPSLKKIWGKLSRKVKTSLKPAKNNSPAPKQ